MGTAEKGFTVGLLSSKKLVNYEFLFVTVTLKTD